MCIMLALLEHFRGIFTEKNIFAQKNKNKNSFTTIQLCIRNFFVVLLKIVIKFRYDAHSDWLKTHGLWEYKTLS